MVELGFKTIQGIERIGDVSASLAAIEEIRGPDGRLDTRILRHYKLPIPREEELENALKPAFALVPTTKRDWNVVSSEVPSHKAHFVHGWHSQEDDFYLASNRLTTQVLCVVIAGQLSCRQADVRSALTEHPEHFYDPWLVEHGALIVSLLPGSMYHLTGNPYHRGAVNPLPDPIDRTHYAIH